MTITLGGLEINDNMYLSGLENAPGIAFSQVRTILGTSVTAVKPLIGGRSLVLGSQKGKSLQGIWCSHIIDSLKPIESQGSVISLDYRGNIFNVIIVKTSFSPMLVSEVEGPNKKFTGEVYLVEA